MSQPNGLGREKKREGRRKRGGVKKKRGWKKEGGIDQAKKSIVAKQIRKRGGREPWKVQEPKGRRGKRCGTRTSLDDTFVPSFAAT